jgi:hypothetical protein
VISDEPARFRWKVGDHVFVRTTGAIGTIEDVASTDGMTRYLFEPDPVMRPRSFGEKTQIEVAGQAGWYTADEIEWCP